MILFSNENEKRDAVIAGPKARCTDATVWARPFVAPSISLGVAEEIYMKIQPEARQQWYHEHSEVTTEANV
jgi:hypothetical protein